MACLQKSDSSTLDKNREKNHENNARTKLAYHLYNFLTMKKSEWITKYDLVVKHVCLVA